MEEEVKTKEELDQLMREKYGEPKQGARTDLKLSSESEEGWSQDKTSAAIKSIPAIDNRRFTACRSLKTIS